MYGHESLFAHHQIQAEAITALSTLYGLRHSLNCQLFMVCVTVLMVRVRVRVRVRLGLGLVCQVCHGLHGLHQGFNGLSAMVGIRVLMACQGLNGLLVGLCLAP